MSEDRLIPISVAAKLLACNTRTVYRHLDEGNLDKIKTGARKGYMVWRSQVKRLREERGY